MATILTALALAPIHPFGGAGSVEGAAAITEQPDRISGIGTVGSGPTMLTTLDSASPR